MTSLTQALLSQTHWDMAPLQGTASRFRPEEIRQSIADLVQADRLAMADALSAAGLSLYPESEDILAISALLAELRQEWILAGELLQQLAQQQGMHCTATTWLHLVRVLRCQCEPAQAMQYLAQALAQHPHDAELQQELDSLNAQFNPSQLMADGQHQH